MEQMASLNYKRNINKQKLDHAIRRMALIKGEIVVIKKVLKPMKRPWRRWPTQLISPV